MPKLHIHPSPGYAATLKDWRKSAFSLFFSVKAKHIMSVRIHTIRSGNISCMHLEDWNYFEFAFFSDEKAEQLHYSHSARKIEKYIWNPCWGIWFNCKTTALPTLKNCNDHLSHRVTGETEGKPSPFWAGLNFPQSYIPFFSLRWARNFICLSTILWISVCRAAYLTYKWF